MIALLASPLARWAGVAALVGAVALWGWTERAGRHVAVLEALEAIREANGLRETIRRMEVRNVEDNRARRSADPVGELRRDFQRD